MFSLGGWCRQIRTGFLRPRPTQDPAMAAFVFGYAAFTPYGRPVQAVLLTNACPASPSFNPGTALTAPVWAPPLSLAATRGITVVFSSCGYLDVSVPRVRPTSRGSTSSMCWVPPFGNHGINGHLRLPRAYRSLSRPSSPPRAQASPVRSYLTFSSRVSIVKVIRISSILLYV